MERNILDFIEHHVEVVRDIERAAAQARWETLISGDEDARRLWTEKKGELAEIYGDREQYARVRAYDEESTRRSPVLQRQLRALRLRYAAYQIPQDTESRLAETADTLERTARTWRVDVGGDGIPVAEARRVLEESSSLDVRRRTWEAAMLLGDALGPEMVRLVGVRNRMARDLDYEDYYDMAARFVELEDADGVTAEVLAATAGAHARHRRRLDAEVAKTWGVPKRKLAPWHFSGFWGEGAPGRHGPDLDRYLGDDPLTTAQRLFDGIGLDVSGVLSAGDFRAEATRGRDADYVLIDRDTGDARVRCVVGPGGGDLDRLIELLVRAVATRHLQADVPWILREPPHDVVTAAIGRVVSRLARSREHLTSLPGANKSAITRMTRRREEHRRDSGLLELHLKCAVARFERALYADPGQDLERTWWDEVREVLRMDEPDDRQLHHDWATNLELATHPLANLRDLIVEIAAAQIESALREELGEPLWGNRDVGAFFAERAFALGASLHWRRGVERLAGEPLNPESWVASVVAQRT